MIMRIFDTISSLASAQFAQVIPDSPAVDQRPTNDDKEVSKVEHEETTDIKNPQSKNEVENGPSSAFILKDAPMAMSDIDPNVQTNCQMRIGRITHVGTEDGVIDAKYFFYKSLLDHNTTLQTLQPISFIVYRPNDNVDWGVKRIDLLEHDIEEPIVTRKFNAIHKTIESVVKSRRGPAIIVFANDSRGNMDLMKCEFTPIIGDVVTLGALVECTDDGDDIIEINSLSAITREVEGVISHVDLSETGEIVDGIIDHDTRFFNNVCDHGYFPEIGDKVLYRFIENTRGTLTRRAINVLLLKKRNGSTTNSKMNDTIMSVKDGISVIAHCEQRVMKIGRETIFQVVVKNDSRKDEQILEIVLKYEAEGVMKLEKPITYPVYIQSSNQFEFNINATFKYPGSFTDVLVVKFENGLMVGTRLEIFADHKRKKGDLLETYNDDIRAKQRNYADVRFQKIKKILPRKLGYLITGIRPVRTSAFMPKKLPDYPVPDDIKDLMIGDGNVLKRNKELKEDLIRELPKMVEELNEENYTFKFHNLLHFEDFEMQIGIKHYDCEGVVFSREGDFMVMFVENLSERRPSLVTGDTCEVTDPSLPNDSEDASRSEGYVHKVQQDSIKLKFTEAFHSGYDGRPYNITFVHSRSAVRRYHMAIDEVKEYMKGDWLFPNSLENLKRPQVNIIDEIPKSEEEAPPHVCVFKADDDDDDEPKNLLDALALEEPDDEEAIATEHGKHIYSLMERDLTQPITFDDDKYRRKGRKERSPYSNGGDYVEDAKTLKGRIEYRDATLEWVNVGLNHYQKEVVRNVLKGVARPLPYIIFGPPGTGKTVTIVETILQIIHLMPESRVLVAAPSNSSADLICERLISWNLLRSNDLVRIVGYNYMSDSRISPVLKPFCTCIDTKKTDKAYKDETFDEDGIKYSPRARLAEYKIVVSTCATVGTLNSMAFPKQHFTHIIVDEAGQATEPEIMVPFVFLAHSGHAILAGDPLQLGPVITSRVADQMGLGESFLNRLLIRFPYHRDPESFPETDGYDPRLVTRLLYNYRATPQILELYSFLFYESKLIPKICGKCSDEAKTAFDLKETLQTEAKQVVHSIIFHGIKGRNHQDFDSPSWYNPSEISTVMHYVMKIHSMNISSDDIGIVTPYQKQAYKLKEKLRDVQIDPPKIGTVEEFQGQERKIIIISTVRSDTGMLARDRKFGMGFVACKPRVNVAVSRARSVIIIIGNPDLLSTDATWRNLIKLCVKRGYYVGCDLPKAVL